VRRRKAAAPAAPHANGSRDFSSGQTGVQGLIHTDHITQAVYDGRTALGTIELIDGAFVAVDSTGKVVGSFDTLKAAARSLPAREGAR
jgi:hypothetical protein